MKENKPAAMANSAELTNSSTIFGISSVFNSRGTS